MAAIAITAANVIPSTAAILTTEIAGGTITAGESLYKDPADQKVKLFKANSGTPAIALFYGIAMCNASAGQKIVVCTKDNGIPGSPATGLNIGATLTVGQVLIGGATAAGDIAPVADNTTGWVCQPIGVCVAAASNASIINFDPIANTIAT